MRCRRTRCPTATRKNRFGDRLDFAALCVKLSARPPGCHERRFRLTDKARSAATSAMARAHCAGRGRQRRGDRPADSACGRFSGPGRRVQVFRRGYRGRQGDRGAFQRCRRLLSLSRTSWFRRRRRWKTRRAAPSPGNSQVRRDLQQGGRNLSRRRDGEATRRIGQWRVHAHCDVAGLCRSGTLLSAGTAQRSVDPERPGR